MEYMAARMDDVITGGISEREYMMAELATLRDENERLRGLVKDSVNLLDFLFEPGSYVPAVRLFCEKVKEALK